MGLVKLNGNSTRQKSTGHPAEPIMLETSPNGPVTLGFLSIQCIVPIHLARGIFSSDGDGGGATMNALIRRSSAIVGCKLHFFHTATSTAPLINDTGLYGYHHLKTAKGFQRFADDAIERYARRKWKSDKSKRVASFKFSQLD